MENNKPRSLIEDINNFLLIKILIFYIIGIILGETASISATTGIVMTGIFSAMMAYATWSRRMKTDHRINFMNGLSFAGLWISAAILITAYHRTECPDLQQINDGIKYGVIASPPEEKPKSYKATVELMNQHSDRIIAYFEKDSSNNIPKYGDLIGFVSEIRYITNSGNPLEFDYAKHCGMQGIYCQAYIKNSDFRLLKQGYRNGIRQIGYRIRERLIDIYRKSGISGRELAVLEALTLGYKNDLDDETVASFQTSGAMHILAVSGLHTGIIMLITSALLSFLNNGLKSRIFKGAIIIATLWLFAAITGLSSSVCRSALMFSLLSFSQMLRRPSSTYNTVAASALILLLINPMLIFNVGFLLSYLAVISIITCMPLMERLKPEDKPTPGNLIHKGANWLKTGVLGIVMVSLAAQLGTGVLSIRTFRIWPVYFLITNIAVIPLSYIIMILAIILLISSVISTSLCEWVTELLGFFLKTLTSTVSGIENLPISSIRDIYITNIAAIVLYASIVLMLLWLHYRKTAYLKAALAAVIAFISSNVLTTYVRNINSQLIIYNKNKTALYTIYSGSNLSIYTNADSLDRNSRNLTSGISALYGAGNISNIRTDSMQSLKDRYFEINGKSFMILNNNNQINAMYNGKYQVDYLIISNNTYITPYEAENVFGAQEVIFDSSNTAWFVEKREKELSSNNIATHYVARDGAFAYGDGLQAMRWY